MEVAPNSSTVDHEANRIVERSFGLDDRANEPQPFLTLVRTLPVHLVPVGYPVASFQDTLSEWPRLELAFGNGSQNVLHISFEALRY